MATKSARIGLVSDSHGDFVALLRAYRCMGSIDLLIHAGDHFRDGKRLSEQLDLPVIAVAGNCDRGIGPCDELVELFGLRFFITHGHTMAVKVGTRELVAVAARYKCDVVVYGHTHVPKIFDERGILFVNPGSVSYPRQGSAPSYGMIEIAEGRAVAEIFELAKG